MNIPDRVTGPAILALAFAVNALHNHTALGGTLGHIPGFYPIVFFIGIGVVLPALALGRTVRREPAAARPLGVALGWRDAFAVLAALVIGCALAAKPLGPIVAQPGGMAGVATLFAQLLVASTAEVMLFLGATGMGLRALARRTSRLALRDCCSLSSPACCSASSTSPIPRPGTRSTPQSRSAWCGSPSRRFSPSPAVWWRRFSWTT